MYTTWVVWCALARNLKNLNGIDLAGNKLTGDIPPQMGYLGGMISADVRNNSLGCTALTRFNSSSNQSGGNTAFCDVTKLLPCFLELTDFTVPRSDSSNMACPEIRRKPYTQALADCGVSTQLVSHFVAAWFSKVAYSHVIALNQSAVFR